MYTEDVKELGRGLNNEEKRNKVIFRLRVHYYEMNTCAYAVTHPEL